MNYTVKEVAKKLKVSKTHVYDLVRQGHLKKVEGLGKVVRIPSTELENIGAKNIRHEVQGTSVTPVSLNPNIRIFSNPEFGKVRTIVKDNEPWFVGKDVAEALGYIDTKSAVNDHIDQEDKMIIQKGQITSLEIPNRGMTVINESGLYSLILSSKLPTAKKFKHWVTSEVLPQIRQTGGYVSKSKPLITDNYFSEFSEETKHVMVNDLRAKNLKLFDQKTKIETEILNNIDIIGKLEPSKTIG